MSRKAMSLKAKIRNLARKKDRYFLKFRIKAVLSNEYRF